MPSEKRARQRAYRDQKQAVIQRSRKRRVMTRRALTAAVLAVVIVLVVILVSRPGSKSAKPPTTTAPATTAPATTAPSTTQPLTSVAVAPTCPPASGASKRVVWFSAAPGSCISKTAVVDAVFKTSVGSFTVRMDAASSYAAVNNFVFLARYKYFDGTFFHRVIPGFVVQGGDPTGLGTGGPHALPGYSFTGNTPPKSCTTKPTQAACYYPGDIAMANSTGPTTDGSQFFIVLPGGQKTLDSEPNYTDFGKVTSGLSVVEKIGAYGSSSGTPSVKVYLLTVTVTQVSG